MKRLKKCAIEDYDQNRFWAKNIRTNSLVKVLVVDYYYSPDSCEVKYLDKNYIVKNEDLITIADYNSYVSFAEQNGISVDEAEQAMINNVSLEEFKTSHQ